ncbi:TlpA family protein disulfide reductase [Sandaracinus amylolyticus]|uniref:TlpA family protein disulfide reductase n=1 Tax=Sandaracinus amylolyticus TaxID=927083 RepID=UPI001F354169|nr:TlpA disulfide reductase family protein [Sandaracinus amylolyticus]UJR81363.1 Thioredoxin domain-containing protein [Sandaracinus amylolyticus]
MLRSLAGSALFTLLVACGGASASSSTTIGSSHAPRPEDAIDLSLRTHDGRALELSDQQGSPVLLFLFATYDGASLAAARGVARFTREALDTVVIAVALQPDAETFTAAYVESQSPPYTVAYEPAGRILLGTTDLGAIDSIPTLVMIDAHGREVARHTGYVSERVIEQWHQEAMARGGIMTPAETPTEEAPRRPTPLPVQTETPPPPESDEAPPDDALVIEPD